MNRGFTLIELLVTISILAILGTITVSIFFNALATTRDGKRMADVIGVAKSLEATRDYTNEVYKYNLDNYKRDFLNGLPADPFVSSGRKYCISLNTVNKTPPSECNLKWESSCPTECNGSTFVALDEAVANFNNTPVLSWTICASMEKKDTPFCEKSLQR